MKKAIYAILLVFVASSFTSCYEFNREQAEKDAESAGKQILFKAESSKKADIEEAKAKLESAKLNQQTQKVNAEADAEAKLIRSKADAQAKLIQAEADAEVIGRITKAVQGNDYYLMFKQINAISQGKSVFVPTESGMPIIMQNK